MPLHKRQKIRLLRQIVAGHLNYFWFGPLFVFLLKVVLLYRCPEKRAVRRQVRDILIRSKTRPILICANHLTMIDSMLITWLLFDFKTLFYRFHLFPWNVPEMKNFGRNWFLRAMCYIGKCVYVQREGSVASRRMVWEKISFLNRWGETICIFPEGGRSRTGRLDRDAAMYGVGQLVQSNPKTLVLAVYLRGVSQEAYGFLPRWRERFFIGVREVSCVIAEGRKAQRDITMQIFDQLEAMEGDYLRLGQ